MSPTRLLAPLAALVVLAAACGSSSPPPIVAQATTSTTTTTTEAPTVVESETVSIEELRVGMCSDTADIDTARGQISLVDCAQPHRYEVFAAVPASAIVLGEDGFAAAVQRTCEEVSELETGVRADGALIGVIGFNPAGSDSAICVWEAPDQRTDFFARAPLDLPPVQVTRSQLAEESAFTVASHVAGDGADAVIVLGRASDGPDDLDAVLWRSGNGGASFAGVSDTALSVFGNTIVPEAIEPIGSGYLAIGTRYGEVDPQPWAVVSNATGTAWTPLNVPLGGRAGAELRFAVTRDDGTVEIIGAVYDRRGDRRTAVWTWGGFSLSAAEPILDEEEFPGVNEYVEAAFVDRLGVTIHVSGLDAPGQSGWRSAEPGVWTAFDDVPSLQGSTAVVADATFAMRGGALSRQDDPGGDWRRVELPGHDGARPDAIAVATDGEQVLVVGTMASVQGETSAFWLRDGGGEFELIYFDVDQAGRSDAPLAATPVDGGFVVVGSEDPDNTGGRVGLAWTIALP